MITSSKDKIKKAERLFEVIQQRKALEKEEQELKEFFRTIMEDYGSILAGGYTVTAAERVRSSFDVKRLTEDKGSEFVLKYQNEMEYKVIDVVKAKKL